MRKVVSLFTIILLSSFLVQAETPKWWDQSKRGKEHKEKTEKAYEKAKSCAQNFSKGWKDKKSDEKKKDNKCYGSGRATKTYFKEWFKKKPKYQKK